MFYKEFAIEPGQIKSLQDLKLIEARFGYDKGALISAFPRKWFRDTLASLKAANDDTKVDSLTDLLSGLKDKILHRYSRQYDGEDWLSSARLSHQQQVFHRVVAQTVSEPPVWLDSLYSLTDEDFVTMTHSDRTAASMANVAETLLANAEKVTLLDPYLDPTNQGYLKTLGAMMQKCQKDAVTFTIICEENQQPSWPIRENALAAFKQNIPANIRCHWAFLDDAGTGFIHQRMLFTAKGGIIYDRGFNEPNDLDQKKSPNNLSLLTCSQLQKATMDFNLAQLTEPLSLAQAIWKSK